MRVILFFLLLSVSSISYCQDDSTSCKVTNERIIVKHGFVKSSDVYYESARFKIFLNRNDLIRYLSTNSIATLGDTLNTKQILSTLKSSLQVIRFVDVEWIAKTKHIDLYNLEIQRTFLANPRIMLSNDFMQVLYTYLKTGKIKIYDKQKHVYYSDKYILFKFSSEHRESKTVTFFSDDETHTFYLKNGVKLFEYKYGESIIV